MAIKHCRECSKPVSDEAMMCPHCGAPAPAREKWDGWGWEYKSETVIAGLPRVHIAFKYKPPFKPVVARGWLAIGQFAVGGITISQFGIGLVSVSQFTLAGFAVAQIGAAYSLIAQIGIYVDRGYGQVVRSVAELLGG
jgi:RNA polymerase subunit RPABC4/transcription elongation factor Spt4